MSIFDRFKKKKEDQVQDSRSQAVQADQEKEAYRKLQSAFAENRAFLARKEMDPDTVFRVFHGENVTIRVFPAVTFPTGSLVAADPLAYLPQEEMAGHLQRSIPTGRYALSLGILQSEIAGIRMSGMKLTVSDRKPVTYEMAKIDMHLADGTKKPLDGCPVDAGLLTICDAKTAEDFQKFAQQWYADHPEQNLYDDYFEAFFVQSWKEEPKLQREGGDFIRWQIPGTDEEIVMAASGFGDGFYNLFWGLDESGNPVELAALFIDPGAMETVGESDLS